MTLDVSINQKYKTTNNIRLIGNQTHVHYHTDFKKLGIGPFFRSGKPFPGNYLKIYIECIDGARKKYRYLF